MGYSEALNNYLNAYNAKAKLEADPLSESGVIAEEEKKLKGIIPFMLVQQYDSALVQIQQVLPQQIQAQQDIMDSNEAMVKTFFGLNAGQPAAVAMSSGQFIILVEGEIQVVDSLT